MTNEFPLLNNRYQLEVRLGAGGMATVYRGRDRTLERVVAVKVLREDFSKDQAFRDRFHQEAKAAANLTHPNIVTVHDFGLDAASGRLFIVMEHVPGTDLKTILQQRGRFTVEEAIPLMIQACAGLGYAHRAGLVHCDVKPHNFLVMPDGRLKVTDFGIARALASIQPGEKSDVVWGSPMYFSPEQASGLAPSPASDVYSLGVILYEMLTGRPPFLGNSASELVRLHRDILPRPPRTLNPAIPPTLEKILLKVLSKEPAARYRTADQLGRVLMSYNRPAAEPTPVSAQSPIQRPPVSQPAPVYAQTPQPAELPPSPALRYGRTTVPSPPAENPLDIDWATWGLALFTLLAVGGLIPLWVLVYFTWR